MALALNHFSIRTTDLDATGRFYAQVLYLTIGPRPALPFPGLWVYRGDPADVGEAVGLIIGMGANGPARLKQYPGDADVSLG